MTCSPKSQQESKTEERLIVALDVETAAKARAVIAELQGVIGTYKIGLQLFASAGSGLVRELAESGIKIFLDLKFHDIPNTVAKAAVEAARLGVWMFNVHSIGGSEMMKRTVGAVREVCEKDNLPVPKIIGVTVLTSSNEEALHEIGIERKVEEQVLNLAKLTAKCGLDGVVASPLEVGPIRNAIARSDFLIVTPGIRPDFATNNDQKRVMTPVDALETGSDYLIIGRPVIDAPDRLAAVKSILADMESVSE